MKVFRGFDELPPFRYGVATIGSFDGVHGGHRILLAKVLEVAREHGGESIVMTFEPHPRITLGCDEGLKLLNTTDEKLWLLERAGVENVIIIPFTREFSRLSPRRFLAEYVVAKAGVKYLVVGYNHHFGHDKSGDFNYLASSGDDLGLHVAEVGRHLVGSSKVSSTVIRGLVAKGDMAEADRLLGGRYILQGVLQPDGNVEYAERRYKQLPPPGVYDVAIDGRPCKATIVEGGSVSVDIHADSETVMIEF